MGGSRGDIVRPVHRFDRSDGAQHRAAGSDEGLEPHIRSASVDRRRVFSRAGGLAGGDELAFRPFRQEAHAARRLLSVRRGITAGSIRQQPRIRHRHPRVSRRGRRADHARHRVDDPQHLSRCEGARVRRRGVVGHRSARHGHRAAHRRLSARALQLACGFPRQRAAHGDRAGRRHLRSAGSALEEAGLVRHPRLPHLPRRHGAVPVGHQAPRRRTRVRHPWGSRGRSRRGAAGPVHLPVPARQDAGRRPVALPQQALHGGHHRHRGLHVRHGDPALHAFPMAAAG